MKLQVWKKNPFFLPESRSRDPQVACPKKHFFDDGLGYKSLVNEWFIEWLLLLCQEWLLRLLFPRMHLFSPGCSLLKWRTSTKCFHIGRVIQYAFTYLHRSLGNENIDLPNLKQTCEKLFTYVFKVTWRHFVIYIYR